MAWWCHQIARLGAELPPAFYRGSHRAPVLWLCLDKLDPVRFLLSLSSLVRGSSLQRNHSVGWETVSLSRMTFFASSVLLLQRKAEKTGTHQHWFQLSLVSMLAFSLYITYLSFFILGKIKKKKNHCLNIFSWVCSGTNMLLTFIIKLCNCNWGRT